MQTNTESSAATPDDGGDTDSDKLPLNGGSSYDLYASVDGKGAIAFSSTSTGQQYAGIKWNRVSTSQSLAITFTLSSDIQYFETESAPVLTFDPVDSGHQKASVVPDSNNKIECHFNAYINDPVKPGVLIKVVDPVIVISVKP